MVSVAMAMAGAIGASDPYARPWRFSRTIDPQSEWGGCTPRPRKLRLEVNRMMNTSRRPKSVASGIAMFGRISLRMIHPSPSPRPRAASTKSLTITSRASERAMRNTTVAKMHPAVTMRMGMVLPIAAMTTSPNMMLGIEMNASLKRESPVSSLTPPTAAAMPRVTPMR